MAEALRTVHTGRRELLRGCWWPVGPKLVFDQMAAPVPEIMAVSFYCELNRKRMILYG
jgi:hypothetical protein